MFHQFLFRTLTPAGWRIGQLTGGLSPDQADALAHLEEEIDEYWRAYRSTTGFGHIANTEHITTRATIAVRDAMRHAARENVPADLIGYHTPKHLHSLLGILKIAGA